MTTAPRAAVAALAPYLTAETTIPGFENPIQLGSNELGFPPSPKAVAAIEATAGEGPTYAESDHVALRAALAGRHGLDADHILCGSGSMEIIVQLAQCYLESGRTLLMSQYGYRFPMTQAEVTGADVVLAPERDLTMDVDAMLAAVTPETVMVFAVNPNNPTGTVLPFSEIRRLRVGLPDDVMLVLDSAYGEFVTDPGYETGEALVDEGTNTVVLRTFSKVYGLAALRVGWAYAPDDVVATIAKMRPLGSIPTQALAGATAAVDDPDHTTWARDNVIGLRERFFAPLRQFGLDPVPSQTSFILVHVPDHLGIGSEALYQEVKARGILLRRVTNFGLNNHIRISIGSPDGMAALTEALTDILGYAPACPAQLQSAPELAI
ncbi:MAG: aminotransferase class I/II-fold pyridoxal phosphate-dependent enzyme [Rhodospirillaceae bacterium]|nr:aminotransferase class I/II-fold pyridoxal phosphate-dependent enzyme [Rhodospirillaceae bacterium]